MVRLFCVVAMFALVACGDPEPGEPGGACLADNVCNTGGSCFSEVCVEDRSLAEGEACGEDIQCASDDCDGAPGMCQP